ncbi:MAG: glycosyl hydrolase [Acidobacteriota bacterium]
MSPTRRWTIAFVALLVAIPLISSAVFADSLPAPSPASPTSADTIGDDLLASMQWRSIGPYRGGRSAAVAGVVDDRDTYYFGGTGGGVWKTTDGGNHWEPVSDGFFGGSIGAVAVSEWDPNVIYVGGGEKTVRGNVSHGDGMFKSTDAGKTWQAIGLEDSRHIPRIRIHPKNPDLVYVAALGHLFGPNEQRGVFRSTDGGDTWESILFVNEDAGAIDLIFDPTNPRILYSTFWRVRRTPYSLDSGGEGSTMWKSTDGGDTWTDITYNEGLPEGTRGISGITVSPSDPDNLYAIIEAEEGGVFRSRDGGDTWSKVNDNRSLRQRAWYYTRIYADPADAEAVYVVNVRFHYSKDGGKSFRQIPTPHGDNHDLWIDPNDPLRMVQANDGGANVSYDGGASWSVQSNQPTAQFYRVTTDNHVPYRIYGAQQDNSTVRILHRSFASGIDQRHWEPTAGGESGHIAPKPDDPEIVYGGSYGGFFTRVDHRTEQIRLVDVWPDNPMGSGAEDFKYRFQWNFPIFFSPHDPNKLYTAANILFVSTNEGQTWTPISPDLTRADPDTLKSSGGPITQDNTGVEYYATIFSAIESPHEPGVLWAGSDDGLIHLSRDGGDNWQNVTPPDLPEWTMINGIDPHPTEPGGLYVAATRYKLDDFSPYLYKTTDYGATWTRIDDGIDRQHFTRALRADPDRPGLLYAGTERMVYVSFDDGASWRPLQLEMPITPITDLTIKDKDLIAATQGRSFWVLDDLAPLHQLDPAIADSDLHLFQPRDTVRYPPTRGFFRRGGPSGANPPYGAVIHYWLKNAPEGEDAPTLELTILDQAGNEIRTFSSAKDEEGEDEILPTEAGMNRFVWNLRGEAPEDFDGMILWSSGGMQPPLMLPGVYRAKLSLGEESTQMVDFEVLPDPRLEVSAEDLAAQAAFIAEGSALLSETHRAIGQIRAFRAQLEAIKKRAGDDSTFAELITDADAIDEKLTAVEEALYQTKNRSRQDPLNFPIRLNDKLSSVVGAASIGSYRPTDGMVAVRDELAAKIREQLDVFEAVKNEDVPALNDKVQKLELPALVAPENADD